MGGRAPTTGSKAAAAGVSGAPSLLAALTRTRRLVATTTGAGGAAVASLSAGMSSAATWTGSLPERSRPRLLRPSLPTAPAAGSGSRWRALLLWTAISAWVATTPRAKVGTVTLWWGQARVPTPPPPLLLQLGRRVQGLPASGSRGLPPPSHPPPPRPPRFPRLPPRSHWRRRGRRKLPRPLRQPRDRAPLGARARGWGMRPPRARRPPRLPMCLGCP